MGRQIYIYMYIYIYVYIYTYIFEQTMDIATSISGFQLVMGGSRPLSLDGFFHGKSHRSKWMIMENVHITLERSTSLAKPTMSMAMASI